MDSALWVFGYGSLLWRPGFDYDRCLAGCVRGWTRRFWQGNTQHRGCELQPARVATLVEEKEGEVWGCAFRIEGQAALEYLDSRECRLGGYTTSITNFYPKGSDPFPVLLYIATPGNSLWLGDAPMPVMAKQIATTRGPCGHNAEYIFRLATFMRKHAPASADRHLYQLEHHVIEAVRARGLRPEELLGTVDYEVTPTDNPPEQEDQQVERPQTFEFTARVEPAKLRCLNI